MTDRIPPNSPQSTDAASGRDARGLNEALDAMRACLENNSPAARSRAQFRNVMENLLNVAKVAAGPSDGLPEGTPKGDPTKWPLSKVIEFARWALWRLA